MPPTLAPVVPLPSVLKYHYNVDTETVILYGELFSLACKLFVIDGLTNSIGCALIDGAVLENSGVLWNSCTIIIKSNFTLELMGNTSDFIPQYMYVNQYQRVGRFPMLGLY